MSGHKRARAGDTIMNKLWVTIGFLWVVIYGVWIADCGLVCAEEKTWSGAGDGVSWSDDDNWFPASVPNSENEVLIDAKDLSVKCESTFKAKSIDIGTRENSTLTSENFVFGVVAPDSSSNVAISNHSKGKVVLRGAGVLTLQGQYQDSEESVSIDEPSFLFWIK
ncbi:MAG: hypothetical protein KAJ66_02945 [Candidatus Omnitrophica bacterium]|nr:hypothetical protein [Candidatus Omnitrophota bacterium]